MRVEKAEYSRILVGCGGRHCSCCAHIPKVQKLLEHRKARHTERNQIKFECKAEDYAHG